MSSKPYNLGEVLQVVEDPENEGFVGRVVDWQLSPTRNVFVYIIEDTDGSRFKTSEDKLAKIEDVA